MKNNSIIKIDIMKLSRIFIVSAAVVLLAGCGIFNGSSSELDVTAEELVADALENGNLRFVVDYVQSSRGMGNRSFDGYYLTIKDGKVKSYLPFFGVNYAPAVYGTEPSGIQFEDFPIAIDDSRSKPEKGKYVWRFLAKSGRETVDATITFFSNGTADLVCVPNNRTTMRYSGRLERIPEEKQ